MLVKPVAMWLWVPTVMAMAVRLFELGTFRKKFCQSLCLIIGVAVLVAPWFVRNQYCFGQLFWTKFKGRGMWHSCFSDGENKFPLCEGLEFPDAPNTNSVLATVQAPDVRIRYVWGVYHKLRQLGYSEIESDDLMLAVSLEAIRAQRLKYAVTRAGHFYMFWLTYGTEPWMQGNQPPDTPDGAEKPTELAYQGQETWFVPSLARWYDGFVRCMWHPHWILYLCATLVTALGCVLLQSEMEILVRSG